MSDFVIVNGVLKKYKKYTGKDADVVIPDGVMEIGDRAFYGCSGLTSITIPDSVTEIGWSAFYGCSGLTSITIPDSVTKIGGSAFYGCSGLTSVTIPDGVKEIGWGAFCGCSSLTSIIIPDGITKIDGELFKNCTGLENIVLPKNLKIIGRWAFEGCRKLKTVVMPDSITEIHEDAFLKCDSLKYNLYGNGLYLGNETNPYAVFISIYNSSVYVELPESIRAIYNPSSLNNLTMISVGKANNIRFLKYYPEKSTCVELEKKGIRKIYVYVYDKKAWSNNVKTLAKKGSMNDYDLEIINNGPRFKYNVPVRLIASMARLADPEELTDECKKLYIAYLGANVKKAVSAAISIDRPHLVKALFDNGVIADKDLKAVKKLLSESGKDEFVALVSYDANVEKTEKAEIPAEPVKDPLTAEYEEKLSNINGDKIINKMKLSGKKMPTVLLKDGKEAPEQIFKYILVSHADTDNIKYCEEADKAAQLYKYDSLCAAIDEITDHLDLINYPSVIPTFCRYANASQIKQVCSEMSKWDRSNARIRKTEDIIKRSLALSDTRAAAIWLQRNHDLDDYAKLRGITVDQVYADIIYDFGFDENCKYKFDLGATVVEARLTPELKIELYDTVNQKTVKTLPKKGVDAELHKKLSDELDDMRQNLKKAVKMKTDQIFTDYLDKNEIKAEDWKTLYLKNPLLKKIGSMLVWAQDDDTFTVSGDKLIRSDGTKYEMSDRSVFVAHPMEIEPSDVTAWQKYFTVNGIIQPFPQVWEHVYLENEIKEDRYKGCKIRDVYLSRQEKRGIRLSKEYSPGKHGWYGGHYDAFLYITEFFTDHEYTTDKTTGYGYIEINTIKMAFRRPWSRRTNNIIAFLDRITVIGRVAKDDVSVAEHFPRFTLAQIMEMIDIAEENHAANVAALLLEYKNKTYPDFDPMAEFTLEW